MASSRKVLDPDALGATFEHLPTASISPAHVARVTLGVAAARAKAPDTLDRLARVVRRAIPRWLRLLLPTDAIVRAVSRFFEQMLDPSQDDPTGEDDALLLGGPSPDA